MASPSPSFYPPPVPTVSSLDLVSVPGLVSPDNTPHSILRPIPPVSTPPGNTSTKTSKPNKYYHKVSREKEKRKIADLLS